MKQGDIILCRFPHSGPTPSKNRPALVVQADFYNQRISNVLVAGITGNLINAQDSAHYLIDVSLPENRQTGLRQNSLVSCINLAVVTAGDVDRTIGSLSPDAMKEVQTCLKAALGMS